MASLPVRPSPSMAVEFRPRFPLDPFATSSKSFLQVPGAPHKPSIDLRNPWLLRVDDLPSPLSLRRDVILVLGFSALHTIHSLLSSPGLAKSLVIIVSHAPPQFPLSYLPTICVLRLHSPLEVQDGGSVRLVNILEWAEKIARIWRAHGSNGSGPLELDEFSIGNTASLSCLVPNTSTSPSSNLDLGKSSWRNSFVHVSSKRTSVLIKGKGSSSSLQSAPLSAPVTLPPINPTQRPFDAIIDYITEGIPEKQTLKHTILVTSITRSFLASTLSPYHTLAQLKDNGKSNRKSIAFKDSSLYLLSSTPPSNSDESLHPSQSSSNATPASSTISSTFANPSTVAHMIHILPSRSRPALIQSLHSFFSCFSVSNVDEDIEHAKQYFMRGSTLCDPVTCSQDKENVEWPVLDLILNGTLDTSGGKYWIGSGEDILFLPPGGGVFASKSSQIPGSKSLQPARTVSEHGFVIPRTKLRPQLSVPSQLYATPSNVKDLPYPPTPPGSTSPATLGTEYQPPTFPGHMPRPQSYIDNPHSETTGSVGIAFENDGATPSTIPLRSQSQSILQSHRFPPLKAPKQSPGFISRSLSASSVQTLPRITTSDWNDDQRVVLRSRSASSVQTPPRITMSAWNDDQRVVPRSRSASSVQTQPRITTSAWNDDQRVLPRSRLNTIIDVEKEESMAQDKLQPSRMLLATPSDSDDSNEITRRMPGNGVAIAGDHEDRKLRWKFWKRM